MNNKETLQSYNSRLAKNNVSLQDVLDEVNKLQEISLQDKEVIPTKEIQTVTYDEGYNGLGNVTVNAIPNEYIVANLQDKSITLTENGTQTVIADEGYDGLNSVEVITNVSGGISNKSVTEEFYDAYTKLFVDITPEYNKKYDTNEEVTIYSPDSTYTKYFIMQNSSDKFILMWTKPLIPIMSASKSGKLYWYKNIRLYGMTGDIINGDTKGTPADFKYLLTGGSSETVASNGRYQASGTFDTIEDAINALKDSSTVYHKQTYKPAELSGLKNYGNTNTAVIMTNFIEIGQTNLVNECARQLSSNETIAVIPTE